MRNRLVAAAITVISILSLTFSPLTLVTAEGNPATERIPGDTQSSGAAFDAAVSANGRYVAFDTSSALVAADTNSTDDVYIYDRQTGTNELISVATGGAVGNGTSFYSVITPDGRYVAFGSSATNLIEGGTSNSRNIFIRDRQNQITELVIGGSREVSGISDDGRYLAYVGAPPDTYPTLDIQVYVRDRLAGITEWISVDNQGTPGSNYSGKRAMIPTMSGDGRYIVFTSTQDLVFDTSGTTFNKTYLRDRANNSTELISRNVNGEIAQGYYGSVSYDGRYVTFSSGANNLITNETNNKTDVFVRDRLSQTNVLLSTGIDGEPGNGDSSSDWIPFITPNAQYIVFESTSSNLVNGDTVQCGTRSCRDIFLHDRTTGITILISQSTSGDYGNSDSTQPVISSNGRYIGYQSVASNLIENDTNNVSDVFLRDTYYDSVPPTVAGVTSLSPNPNGWYNTNVTIDWQATDPAPSSGTPTDPTSTIASTEGANVVYASELSCDPNGNCATGSIALSIDKTAPTVSNPSVSPAIKLRNQTATVTAAAADSLSGIDGGEYYINNDPGAGNGTSMAVSGGNIVGTIGNNLAPGTYTIGIRSKDKAGNWSNTITTTLVVLI